MEKLGKIYHYENYLEHKNKIVKVEYIASGKKETGEILNLYKAKIDAFKLEEEFMFGENDKSMDDVLNEIFEWAKTLIEKELMIADKKRRQFFAVEAAKKRANKDYVIKKYKEGYK